MGVIGERLRVKLPGVNVPPGFGIPIYYYAQHMRQSGLAKEVASMLAHPRWKTSAAYRKRVCDELRAKIEAAPIDARLLEAAWAKVETDLGARGVFVRSSTNVEDLVAYGAAAFFPVLAVLRLVKIGENSLQYSLQDTTRHALFLVASRVEKFVGKTAADTIAVRLGAIMAAVMVMFAC